MVTDDAVAELNRLSEDTIINGKKYIDMVRQNCSSEELNTRKAYEIISGSDIRDNYLICNDGVFNEVFYKEVEP